MSDVRLVILEARQDWSGSVHEGDADLAIAALSADPVSLAELATAASRFVNPNLQTGLFGNLRPGCCDEPRAAGFVVIDLVARLVIVASTYASPGPAGTIRYRGDEDEADTDLPYHLADDWQFIDGGPAWRSVAEAWRCERLGEPPLDARAVLYGSPLLEFVVRETWAAFQRRAATDLDNPDRLYDTLKNIHAAWLLTPCNDLRGACPREVLLDRHDHLMRDLQDRSRQWSQLGECPPGLDESSFAFRYGGFGTHELVMYYELVRELLWSTWNHLEELSPSSQVQLGLGTLIPEVFLVTEVSRLEGVCDKWLDTPDPELDRRTPRSIIHRERRRLPEGGSGEDAMIDPDCPCCQMLCDLPGPVFWHLDSSEMDDDFAFDIYHNTVEEWEREQRRLEEPWDRFDVDPE